MGEGDNGDDIKQRRLSLQDTKESVLSQRELLVESPPVGVSQRKCTDVLFLIVFLLFWIGQIVVAVLGFENGDPRRLVFGSDYAGRVCGGEEKKDQTLTAYPRTTQDVFLNSAQINRPWEISFFGICVESCPKEGDYICTDEAEEELQNYLSDNPTEEREAVIQSCIDDPFKTNCPENEIAKGCFDTLFNTTSVFFRCFPNYIFEEERINSESGCIQFRNVTNLANQQIETCVKYKDVRKITRIEPTAGDLLFDSFNTISRAFSRYMGDVFQSYPVIIGCGVGFTASLGLFYIIAIWYVVGPLVWGSVIGSILLLLAITIYCYVKSGQIEESIVSEVTGAFQDAVDSSFETVSGISNQDLIEADEIDTNSTENSEIRRGTFLTGRLQASADFQREYEIASYFFTALTILFTILVLSLSKRISRAVEIFQEASTAIKKNSTLILLPAFAVPAVVLIVVFWGVSSAYVASSGTLETSQLNQSVSIDPNEILFEINSYASFSYSTVFLVYLFFGMLWSIEFVHGIIIMITAGAVGSWYWAGSSTTLAGSGFGKYPVLRSVYVTFRFHLGSIAFGAILVSLVQLVRYILAYIQTKSIELSNNSRVMRILLLCVQCVLKCLELCVKFISRNAFLHMAMYGDSFCSSTYAAFITLTSNLAQVAMITFLGDIILRFGQIFITVISGLVCWAYLDNTSAYGIGGSRELNTFWWPTFLTMLLAWFTSEQVLGIYDIAVDTILINYCQDKKLARAQRKEGGKTVASKSFRKFVTKYNPGTSRNSTASVAAEE